MRPKGMETLAALSVRGSKESSSRGKRRVFLHRRTVRVKVRSKVIRANFSKLKEKEPLLGRKTREKWLVELLGNQNPGLEAPSRSKRGGRKGDIREGAMKKNRHFRVIEGKLEKMIQSNTSSPRGRKYLLSPREGDGN